jgi:hypothetical protein
MWQCPQCKQRIADNFDACWKCGTNRDGTILSAFVPNADDPSLPDPEPALEELSVGNAQGTLRADATKRGWPQFTIRSLLLLTTAVAVVLGFWQWWRGPIHSLPQPDDVVSMKMLWRYDDREGRPEIEIPEKHWKEIFAALSPSDYDPWPCNWLALATIEIQTKQNHRYRLDAYYLRTEPIGAFSVGPTFKERTYRRGGNSAKLKEALMKVYAESEVRNSAAATIQ